ncbi:MAG: Gldg family protein, partial [Huintestinicola sp.]
MGKKKKKSTAAPVTTENTAADSQNEALEADVQTEPELTEESEDTANTDNAEQAEAAPAAEKTEDAKAEDKKKEKTVDPDKAKQKAFRRRKLKYGSVATAITLIVIAVVVMVNVIVNLASDRVNMSIDLTPGGTFEISQETKDYLDSINEPVEIVCLSDELTFQTSNYIYFKQAYEVLKKYSIYSDNVTVKYVDMTKDPTYANKFSSMYSGEISEYSIVVQSNKRIKVLAIMDLYNVEMNYYTFSQEVKSTKAEQELTSAIMYVTDPDPLHAVVFRSETQGSSYDNVMNMLTANGIEVTEIDPLIEVIPEGTDIVVINAPMNDYDPDTVDKLYNFLDNGGKLGKNLIYIADYSQKTTSNIDAFLAEWGISVDEGIVGDMDSNNVMGQSPYTIRDYITENDFSNNVPEISLPVLDYRSRP